MFGLLAIIVYPLLFAVLSHDPAPAESMNFYFLLFSLFFPRIVLLVYIFLFPNLYPANTVPQWADIALGVLVPRVLILIYIYQNMGYDNIWFVAHLIVAIAAYFGGGRTAHRRRYRRDVVVD